MNHLARVEAGRWFRAHTTASRPLRVGNLKSPNVCSAISAFDLLAELALDKLTERRSHSSSLAGQLPNDPSDADGERSVDHLEDHL
jgi:hypothetical protein